MIIGARITQRLVRQTTVKVHHPLSPPPSLQSGRVVACQVSTYMGNQANGPMAHGNTTSFTISASGKREGCHAKRSVAVMSKGTLGDRGTEVGTRGPLVPIRHVFVFHMG